MSEEVTVRFQGREWQLNPEHVTVQQAIAIQLTYGFTVAGWLGALQDIDPRAMQCLYWLMLQQNGEIRAIKDCDFDLMEFGVAYADALGVDDDEPEPEESPEPVPTRPAGPPSPGRPTRPATTRARRAPEEAAAGPATG